MWEDGRVGEEKGKNEEGGGSNRCEEIAIGIPRKR